MARSKRHLALLCALLGGFVQAGVGTAAPAKARPKIQITASNGDVCKAFAKDVGFHLESRKRFDVAQGAAHDYELALVCEGNGARGELKQVETFKGGKTATSAIVTTDVAAPLATVGDRAAAALLLVNRLLDLMPWDGEVTLLAKGGGPASWSPLSDAKPFKRATLSIGTATSPAVVACAPFEVGRLDPKATGAAKFVPTSQGVLEVHDEFQSFAEVTAPKKGRGPLVFRFIVLSEATPAVRNLVKTCREKSETQSDGALTRLFVGGFSTESIELNGINQSFGASYLSLTASNGQKVTGFGAFLQNQIRLGTFLQVDGRYMTDVQHNSYQPILASQAVPALISIGEASLDAVFNVSPTLRITPGVGVFFAKVNIPYIDDTLQAEIDKANGTAALQSDGTTAAPEETKSLPNRKQILTPALVLGIGFGDTEVFGGSRLSASKSAAGPHVAAAFDLNTKLSKTWFIGADLYLLHFGQADDGGPGATIGSIGAHLGFDLRRGP